MCDINDDACETLINLIVLNQYLYHVHVSVMIFFETIVKRF